LKKKEKLYYGNWDGEICPNVYLSHIKPIIMAGPCMLESRELAYNVAQFLKSKCEETNFSYIFKTSYDKANRTSAGSARGPGLKKGLQWLFELKEELKQSQISFRYPLFYFNNGNSLRPRPQLEKQFKSKKASGQHVKKSLKWAVLL
jgi:hypothetical protein